jgi:pimeloyl-ACP methyl ester carboxylesterase
MPCYLDRLAAITVPVQLVFGERDTKFEVLAAEMARALPHAELVALPGIGHNPVLECPGRVADLLKRGIDA